MTNNFNTPGSMLNLLNFANTNDVDLTKINLKDFIKKIIAEKKYKKDQFVKQLLYSLIELYFRKNVSLKNINLLKIQNTLYCGTDQTPVNFLLREHNIDLKILPYEYNMQDMHRFEVL